MTKRYRLTARAQMHGELRDPGYVFTLADGEVGPHRTISAQAGANIVDHLGTSTGVVDEPLYRELSDEENAAIDEVEAKQVEEADAHAEACAARDAAQSESAEAAVGDDEPKAIEDHSGDAG